MNTAFLYIHALIRELQGPFLDELPDKHFACISVLLNAITGLLKSTVREVFFN